MKFILTYIKMYSLFLLRVLVLRVYIELTIIVCTFIWNLIMNLVGANEMKLPELSYVHLASFIVAIIFAMKTTYFVDGKKMKVWKNTYGFDPNEN